MYFFVFMYIAKTITQFIPCNTHILATTMTSIFLLTSEVSMEKLENTLFGSRRPLKRTSKRHLPTDKDTIRSDEFYEFVEEKLIQHSQALEHLVKMTNEVVSAIDVMAENLGKLTEKPKSPKKMAVPHVREERNGDTVETRRFMRKPLPSHDVSTEDRPSRWCSTAALCRGNMESVCGYDEKFGYGKFDDLCHMLQANCYWNYNFALIPNCKSKS